MDVNAALQELIDAAICGDITGESPVTGEVVPIAPESDLPEPDRQRTSETLDFGDIVELVSEALPEMSIKQVVTISRKLAEVFCQ